LVNIGDWKIAEMMIGYLPSFKKKKWNRRRSFKRKKKFVQRLEFLDP
jgi:hypothetical protein